MSTTLWLPPRRAVRGAINPSIEWQPTNADGDPADLTDGAGDVTVSVTSGDGTDVTGIGTVGGVGNTEQLPRTATLPVAAVASVDWLDITWSLDDSVVSHETVEVVGSVLGSTADIVQHSGNLAAEDAALIRRARLAVEDQATRIMNRSPFERFYRERLDGSGSCELLVSWPDVRAVVWVRVWTSATESTDFTAAEVAACQGTPGGIFVRTDGQVWPCGVANIEIGYRFGWTSIPHDLRLDLFRAVRHKVGQMRTESTPMERATSMQTFDGMNVTLATPGTRGWSTGLPDVDEKLNGYKFARFGVA